MNIAASSHIAPSPTRGAERRPSPLRMMIAAMLASPPRPARSPPPLRRLIRVPGPKPGPRRTSPFGT